MNSVRTALLKLTTLGGVIAGGCFAVMQVQEGLGDFATPAEAASSQTFADRLGEAASAFANPETQTAELGQSVQPQAELADVSPAEQAGNDPFFASVPDADESPLAGTSIPNSVPADRPLKTEPTLAEPVEETLLAQAGSAPNPFAVQPEPTIAPRQFTVPEGEAVSPIGRATLETLAPIQQTANDLQRAGNEAMNAANQFAERTRAQLPAVTPLGALQPTPAQPAGNQPTLAPQPMIRPASATDASPAPAADPFDLGLPAIESSAAPMPAQPAPAPAAFDANPFDLGLEPIAPAPQPVRSASATTQPAPAANPGFDLQPLPIDGPAAGDPAPVIPSRQPVPEIRQQPEVSPFNAQPSPVTARPEPTVPITRDFLGDGTNDRNVPTGVIRPQLELTKVAPPRAVLGKPLVYEIRLANVGESIARDVIVEDRIPKGTKLMGTNPQAEWPEGSKKLVWRFEQLNPGDTKSLKIRVEPVDAGQIGSIATVRFVAEAAAETHIAAPELKFRLVGEPEAAMRDIVNYKFEMSNTGDEDARDVMIRCAVPAGLQSPNNEPDLEYPVGILAAGETKTVDLPLTAIEEGQFTTEASLEATGVSPIVSRTPIRIIKSRLALDRSGPGKRFVGSKVRFVNQVTNKSSKILQQVRITETLPADVTFDSANENGRLTGPQTVVWTLASLAPGETRDLSISYVPGTAGEKQSIVNAQAADGSQTAIKARMTVVGFAALKVENEREVRPYTVGENVTMKMRIKNGGTASANAVTTTVQVPPELRFVGATGPVDYTQTANAIQFQPISEIRNGSDAVVNLTFQTIKAGDARLSVTLQSSDLDKALLHQESIRVVDLQ